MANSGSLLFDQYKRGANLEIDRSLSGAIDRKIESFNAEYDSCKSGGAALFCDSVLPASEMCQAQRKAHADFTRQAEDSFKHLTALYKSLTQDFTEIKNYLLASAKRRDSLIEYLYLVIAINVRHEFVTDIEGKAIRLIGRINAALVFGRFFEEVQHWMFNAGLNGLAGGLHTTYLQYEKPLRLIWQLSGIK